HRAGQIPARPFMEKIDGLTGLTNKIAARLATKPEISSFIRRNSGFCDQCPIRIFVRSRRRMAGAWSAVSAGGRLRSITTLGRARACSAAELIVRLAVAMAL